MEGLINGLKFRFTSTELKNHMLGRAKYHGERADLKEAELRPLREIAERIKATTKPEDVQSMAKGYGNISTRGELDDSISSLEREVRNHRNKVLVFTLFSDHLFEEDYDLGESDLQRLELVER